MNNQIVQVGQKFLEGKSNPDEIFREYLYLHVGNKDFVYLKDSPLKQFKKSPLQKAERLEKFDVDMKKFLESNQRMNISKAPGYSTMTPSGYLSFQQDEYSGEKSWDIIRNAWLGRALSIEIQDGFQILIYDSDILEIISDGWEEYRSILENDAYELRQHELLKWNGIYLYNQLKGYEVQPLSWMGEKSLKSISWSQLLISIAERKRIKMLIWVYKLASKGGDINLGPIVVDLKKITRPIELWRQIYPDFYSNNSFEIDRLFGNAKNFRILCEKGIIGLKEMKPSERIVKDSQGIQTQNLEIYFRIMIQNDEKLMKEITELSEKLFDYEKTERGTKGVNHVKKVLGIWNNPITFLRVFQKFSFYLDFPEIIRFLSEEKDSENFNLFVFSLKHHYDKIKSIKP